MMPELISIVGKKNYGGKKRIFAKYKCPYCFTIYETLKFNIPKNGKTNCGCMTNELKKHTTHNLTSTKLYRVWSSMKQRCFNIKCTGYENYGGRGISVCEEWKNDFISFYDWAMQNGYKEGLTIDRKNNDGNYEPNNCRFVSVKIQNMNKRYKGVKNFIGVEKKDNKFIASLSINNKKHYIGSFDTELEASLARDLYICQNNLQHKQNFNLKENECHYQQ